MQQALQAPLALPGLREFKESPGQPALKAWRVPMVWTVRKARSDLLEPRVHRD